jgi:N-acyl-D-amino-acid deacylase
MRLLIFLRASRFTYDVFFNILIIERYSVNVILFMIGEEDVLQIMKSPLTMIGSDGISGFGVEKIHPRQTGTFARLLGRYVREKGVLSLEEAIRKMTSFPAQTFGLKRKGILRQGFDADLVLFDPGAIIDKSTYGDPNQAPAGISHVVVNGKVAAENGHVTGDRCGMVLRRGINT